jgi:hypothetical protein
MNEEVRALLQLFENKVASLWQLDGQIMECVDDDRAYSLETRQRRVQAEVDTLRTQLVNKITEVTIK